MFKELKKSLIEQNTEYVDYIKNGKESFLGKIPNEQFEEYFATKLEDIRNERSLILLLSLTDPDILKPSKLTDHERK